MDPTLPFCDESFDVVTCVVSVDYLIKPLEVFAEISRVLKPGGICIMSMSNRCFPTKAISIWLETGDAGHVFIVYVGGRGREGGGEEGWVRRGGYIQVAKYSGPT